MMQVCLSCIATCPASVNIGLSIALVLYLLCHLLLAPPPHKPHKPNHEFNPRGNPQRRLHSPGAPTQPPAHNGTDQQHNDRPSTAITLDVGGRRRDEFGITGQVEIDTRQDDGWDFIIPQGTGGGDTSRGLECQQRNRNQLEKQRTTCETRVRGCMRDEICFNQGYSDDDQDGLAEEGDEEGSASAGTGETGGVGEDGCAEEKGGDGDEGFEPAPGFVEGLGGRAKAEEDCISYSRFSIMSAHIGE